MSSISINGNKYLPDNFKKVDLQGKDIETYLKENSGNIKNNFKDEIYVAKGNDLYVAEFKNFPKSDLKKENISFVDIPDAEIKLIDDEIEKHKIAKVSISGTQDKELEKFIRKTLDIDNGDNLSFDDIIGKLRNLEEKGKGKYLNIDVVPVPVKGAKNGEVELKVSVIENPKKINFKGVSQDDAKKLEELFKGDLTKENIQKGIDQIKDYFRNHPSKMLPDNQNFPSLTYELDDKGNLNFIINVIDLPSKANLKVYTPTSEGSLGIQALNEEDNKLIAETFKQPLNPKNIEEGMKKLNDYYAKKGFILVNPNLNINNSGELDIHVIKVKSPTKINVTGMEVFNAEDISNKFKKPLSSDSINEGIEAIKQMYKDKGYLLLGPSEGVEVYTNGEELRVNIHVAKFDGFEVYGNSDTKDNTIIRELADIKQGKPLNLNDLENAINRLRGTGLFSNVGYNLVPTKDGKVKVNIIVNEQKNNEFSLFGGYSIGGGLFGGGGVTFGNLGGTGQSLSIKGEVGTRRLGGSITYTNPWLTDKKVGFSTSLYGYRWDNTQTTEFRVGNTTNFNIPLGKDYLNTKWSLNPSLRTEYIGIDPRFSSSGTGKDFLVMPKVGLNYNSLDNNSNPKEGTKFNISAGLGTGTATFGQFDTSVKHYIPLTSDKKLTLNLGASGGVQVGNTPYYEKYNTWNTPMVYGRAQNSLERDQYYAVGSANLKYNVWGPISLVAGTTVGGIGKNITDLGAGGGIEVNVFGMPISITAGAKYNPVTGEKGTAINLNIFRVDF
ncbi:MAG: hypothetical protein KatS3mg068_2409 [Candidatus Sericytochromatia bacterium]|nr:MAG: hypothetical protein KatS3mg068_2409 [Candidatus Sericytochromatia bacterium]